MARNNKGRTKRAAPPADATAITAETAGTQNAASTGLSYVVPTEFVELPSQGRYYPEGHALSGQEVVEIRHMTAKDEDILTSRSLLKKGLAIDRLIQNLLVDKTIDVNSLLVGDRNAILIQTRIHAYGPDYITRSICPSCGDVSESTFNLLEVENDIGEWADMNVDGPTEQGTFIVALPKTGLPVEVRLMNGHDEKLALKIIENRKKNKLAETSVTSQMKQYIVSIDGHTNRSEVGKFVDNMPTLDAQYLRVAYNALVPNVDMALPFRCAECETESRLEVPFTADFFWPNR